MHVHFIGIGGISMSALAKYLYLNNFIVTGSDRATSLLTDELSYLGIKIYIGHKAENLKNCDLIVTNSAIGEDNIELDAAKNLKLPIIDRAELLSLISLKYKMRIGISGAHGKTTVTALLSHMFACANIKFTAHIGGYDREYGNLVLHGDKIFLSEVCEFKKNIDKFMPDVAVVLNIDNDHMNCYNGIEDLKKTFFKFLDRAQKRIVSSDDPLLNEYYGEKTTFGIKSGDYAVKKIRYMDGLRYIQVTEYGKNLVEIPTELAGDYNLKNILAAVATARISGLTENQILRGLISFNGVKRRNEFIGRLNGAKVIADYCHHPTEIKDFLSGLSFSGRLYVAFQPHTYSRTRILFDEFVNVFKDINNLFIYSTYAARESYDYDGSAKKLSLSLPESRFYDDFDALYNEMKKEITADDTLVILGAGNLYELMCDKIS